MQANNEEIIKITEEELHNRYFESDMDEIMDFNEYKKKIEKLGYKIIG
jgi:hypothetical protein